MKVREKNNKLVEETVISFKIKITFEVDPIVQTKNRSD